jgi:hypothetical protein
MGTCICMDRIAAPFLKILGLPSMLRSPSGYSISTRPWRKPKAPARMAGIRLASGSSTTTRSDFASCRMNPDPKMSLVPTANTRSKTFHGTKLASTSGSRKL